LLIQEENKGRGKVKAIAIWLGSNDAANNEQYVPLDRFKANLRHMIGLCNDNGIKVIIVGVALHDEVHYSDEGVNPRNTMQNLEYSNAAKQVADELGAQFIDMWHGMLDYLGWKQNENEPIVGQLPKETQDPKKLEMLLDLLSDGLHPTGKGYKILYNGIVKAIEHHWPELTPEAIPTLLPSSEEIYEDPSKLDNALE
jgi:lysophospholipase L1-like esterase